jgi:hypothetical protein
LLAHGVFFGEAFSRRAWAQPLKRYGFSIMPKHSILPSFLVAVVIFLLATAEAGAASVQLELIGDAKGGAMAFQEWMQILGKAGIPNVRIRTANDADKPGIIQRGDAYVVTGVILSRDELLLPGGRFRRGEMGRLTEYLRGVGEGETAGKKQKGPYGLTSDQFAKLRSQLASPVGFVTDRMTGRQMVEKTISRSNLDLKLDATAARALDEVQVDADLIDVASGTALAYVLQSGGYGLVPDRDGRSVTLAIEKLRPGLQTWPVGQTSEESLTQKAPALYEFLNVNVQNVAIGTALDSIAKRLKMPILVDRAALARQHLDLKNKRVTLPHARTTYSLALRKLLFQAGMKFEVRFDDGDSPFLWITSVKPG